MQGPTNEAFIPTAYVVDSRIVGVKMRRKKGTRTMPVPAIAAETPALPPLLLPLPPPPEDEDEGIPAAKKQRLQAPNSNSTAAGDGRIAHEHTAAGDTTDSPDDTPTDPMTPAASLPSAATSSVACYFWKVEEDAKLTEAVKKYGEKWVVDAAMVPGRTNVQCRKRWHETLDPANDKKGKWTPEEDAKLTEAVKKHGKEWVKVAAMDLGRTNHQCRQRCVDCLDPAIDKGKWTLAEDAKLTEAVKNLGKKWVKVAAMNPGRTNHQCRQRWVKYLDPNRASNSGVRTQRRQ